MVWSKVNKSICTNVMQEFRSVFSALMIKVYVKNHKCILTMIFPYKNDKEKEKFLDDCISVE